MPVQILDVSGVASPKAIVWRISDPSARSLRLLHESIDFLFGFDDVADSRFRKVESVEGFTRPAHVPARNWGRPVGDGGGEMLKVRAYVSERGMKSFELASLFGKIGRDSKGRGVIVARVPRSEIDFYAARLLSAGTEVKVEAPPELVKLTRQKAKEIAELYS